MTFDKDFLKEMRYRSQGLSSQNPFDQAIYHDDLPHEMASPMHTFVYSGPPLYKMVESNNGLLSPVGLVQDLQYSGQKQISPAPELGNRFMRHAPGRPSHSATITRLLSKSANLAGMLYRWYLKSQGDNFFVPGNIHQPNSEVAEDLGGSFQIVTLDSDIFDIPFGLLVVRMTENGEHISANYWERCLVAGMSETISAGQVVIMENIQLVFSQNRPADPRVVNYSSTRGSSRISEGRTGSSPTGPA